MASSVIISAPNAVLGIPRDVWGINSGVTEAADSTCSCTGWTFAHGDGVNKVFELPSLVSSLSALYRRDWQGVQALSASARTNYIKKSQQLNAAEWSCSGTILSNSEVSPDGTLTASSVNISAIASGSTIIYTQVPVAFTGLDNLKSIFMRGDVGGETVILKDSALTHNTVSCTLTAEWKRYSLWDSGQTTVSGVRLLKTSGNKIYLWGGMLSLQDGSYIPTTTTTVTVTDYAATGNTITLAEAPLLGSDLSVDADLVPHTCLSFNHGGRR